MAKRQPLKGISNATGLGAAIGAAHGVVTSDMGSHAIIRPDSLIANPENYVPGSMSLSEGMTHIATSTGYGALGAAALAGAVHLGVKAYDTIKKNRNLGRQFD